MSVSIRSKREEKLVCAVLFNVERQAKASQVHVQSNRFLALHDRGYKLNIKPTATLRS